MFLRGNQAKLSCIARANVLLCCIMRIQKHRRTLLIVDGPAALLDGLFAALHAKEYKAVMTFDGAETLRAVKADTAEVVITSFQTTGLDSCQVLDEVKNASRAYKIVS